MSQRLSLLLGWLEALQASQEVELEEGWELLPVSGDASFRRYFRVKSANHSWIAVDAPPEKESCEAFVNIALAWREEGVNVPEVIKVDFELGFMLLSDFGDRLFLPELTEASAGTLYSKAVSELHLIQQCDASQLPLYDEALLKREMALFSEWFLQGLLTHELTNEEQLLIEGLQSQLVTSALEQPQVTVHRDYHSRNLMITDQHTPGVIDFQDAVKGPITYDLVSLLRDCYIRWPDALVYTWVDAFREALMSDKRLALDTTSEQFAKSFDLMGMQRHLKVLGIFSRLKLRDGKSGYLKDIPLTLSYVSKVAQKYPEFSEFNRFIEDIIKPAMRSNEAFAGLSIS